MAKKKRLPDIENLPVFVYGTLRKGCGNYEYLLRGNTTKEITATVEGQLFEVAGGGFPALKPGEGTVKGELMYLNEDTFYLIMYSLDRLEGYDPNREEYSMYLRRKVKATTAYGETVDCYTYIWNREATSKRIESGDWVEHSKSRYPTKVYDSNTELVWKIVALETDNGTRIGITKSELDIGEIIDEGFAEDEVFEYAKMYSRDTGIPTYNSKTDEIIWDKPTDSPAEEGGELNARQG